MHWAHQYIRLLIDNLQDLLVIYSSITNSLFPLCQWNWQYIFSPDGTLALASWFSPCCLITGPYSKYHHVWPSSVVTHEGFMPGFALRHMEVNLNEIYASKFLHSIKLPTVIHFSDLTFETVYRHRAIIYNSKIWLYCTILSFHISFILLILR